MDNFAKLDAAERTPFFEETASRRSSTTTAVEKDFWVCWTLKHLFALKHVPELRFKLAGDVTEALLESSSLVVPLFPAASSSRRLRFEKHRERSWNSFSRPMPDVETLISALPCARSSAQGVCGRPHFRFSFS
jgi:hypothetical protein